jgi:hypothetical protein
VLVTISIKTRKNQTSIDKQAVEKIKQFDIEMTKGATLNVDLIPPPSFSQGEVPFQYMYVRRHLGSSNPYINPRNLLTPTFQISPKPHGEKGR